ncbi:MAG: isoprenyl transferase [Candidatus Lernaella stagnicola]|nr:isoprenyl transferase [Candidatus Lernaella stagnicola]
MSEGSSASVLDRLDSSSLPRHIAVIMDGNGRWAKRRGFVRTKGHAQGVETVRMIIKACRRLDIPYLTLYAFSLENWNRPRPEVEALMGLLRGVLRTEVDKLIKNDVRLKAIGRRDQLTPDLREGIADAEQRSGSCRSLQVNVALSYSGRDEIVRAAAALARRVQNGELDPAQIDEALFAASLDTAGIPDPDLLIRTSGELRLSNYLLWQLAYAEIYVTDVMWPDFDEAELTRALETFGRRQRRFGKTGEQIGVGADKDKA